MEPPELEGGPTPAPAEGPSQHHLMDGKESVIFLFQATWFGHLLGQLQETDRGTSGIQGDGGGGQGLPVGMTSRLDLAEEEEFRQWLCVFWKVPEGQVCVTGGCRGRLGRAHPLQGLRVRTRPWAVRSLWEVQAPVLRWA